MRWVFALAVFLTVAACSKPAPPTLVPLRATVTAVSPQGLDMRVDLSAQNPNSVDLSARSLTVKLSLDGRDAGSTTIDHPVTLPAGQTTTLDVPLTLNWTAATSIAGLAAQGRDVPYVLDGSVGLGGDLLHVEVPFHMTGTLKRDDLVKAALQSLPKLPLPL